MKDQGIDADFTACDTRVLNRFFTDYLASPRAGRHQHPPAQPSPPVYLAGRNLRAPASVDHGAAALRTRAEESIDAGAGVHPPELIQLQTTDLSTDLIAQPFVRVVPLKGGRAYTEGRIVPLSAATARAVVAYLRVRRSHRLAGTPALWLGTRNRGPMTGSGLYQMLSRRAEQAGYDPDVHPHQFRHTFAHDWLGGGGAEGDLMRLMGWTDRSMLDRYGADLQVQRAIDAKRRRGDLY